jgi:hypothetical protein
MKRPQIVTNGGELMGKSLIEIASNRRNTPVFIAMVINGVTFTKPAGFIELVDNRAILITDDDLVLASLNGELDE